MRQMLTFHPVGKQTEQFLYSAFFLARLKPQGLAQPTIRVALPTSRNLVLTIPHRHTQKLR